MNKFFADSPLGAYRPPSGQAPVLIVDDDPAGAAFTANELARGGFPAHLESNGDAVLHLVRSEAIQLVVSELRIPCAEGPCVVAALKADRSRLPRLRVLVHTRHTSAADSEWALAAGCDVLVHRPGAAGSLLREVRRLEGAPAPVGGR